METGHLITLAIGLFGSLVIHLSQGLLKLAIERRQNGIRSRSTKLVYGIGLSLNFSAPLWVILANRFGPTVLYTSMYATGLMGLILFSCWKLGRPIRRLEVLGVVALSVGSGLLVLGFRGVEIADMSATEPIWLFGAGLTAALLTWPAVRLADASHRLPVGLVMGVLGGSFLALDALLKGVAQADGGVSGFLPITVFGWALFALSFLGAAAALGMTQWAHARSQPPTATIAGYDAAYVALPVLLLPWAQGQGSRLDPLCLLGLAILLLGLYAIGRANRDSSDSSFPKVS